MPVLNVKPQSVKGEDWQPPQRRQVILNDHYQTWLQNYNEVRHEINSATAFARPKSIVFRNGNGDFGANRIFINEMVLGTPDPYADPGSVDSPFTLNQSTFGLGPNIKFSVGGPSTFGGPATFNNQVSVSGALTVSGAASFSDAASFNNLVKLNASSSFVTDGIATFNNTVKFNNDIDIDGVVYLNNDLYQSGNSFIDGNLDLSEDLIVRGNLTVLGERTQLEVTELVVEDKSIIINKNDLYTPLDSGIFIQKGIDERAGYFKVDASDDSLLQFKAPTSFVATLATPSKDVTLTFYDDFAADQELLTTSNVTFRTLTVDQTFSRHASVPSYSQYLDPSANGKGWISTPWIYTNAIESYSDLNSSNTTGLFMGTSHYTKPNELAIVVKGQESIFVNDKGNIGLGTLSPSSDLHLYKTEPVLQISTDNYSSDAELRFTDFSEAIDSGGMYLSYNANTGAGLLELTTQSFSTQFNISVGGYQKTPELTVKKSNVTINTDLDVHGDEFVARDLIVNNTLYARTNKVGINVNNPTEALNVSGNIQGDSNLILDGIEPFTLIGTVTTLESLGRSGVAIEEESPLIQLSTTDTNYRHGSIIYFNDNHYDRHWSVGTVKNAAGFDIGKAFGTGVNTPEHGLDEYHGETLMRLNSMDQAEWYLEASDSVPAMKLNTRTNGIQLYLGEKNDVQTTDRNTTAYGPDDFSSVVQWHGSLTTVGELSYFPNGNDDGEYGSFRFSRTDGTVNVSHPSAKVGLEQLYAHDKIAVSQTTPTSELHITKDVASALIETEDSDTYIKLDVEDAASRATIRGEHTSGSTWFKLQAVNPATLELVSGNFGITQSADASAENLSMGLYEANTPSRISFTTGLANSSFLIDRAGKLKYNLDLATTTNTIHEVIDVVSNTSTSRTMTDFDNQQHVYFRDKQHNLFLNDEKITSNLIFGTTSSQKTFIDDNELIEESKVNNQNVYSYLNSTSETINIHVTNDTYSNKNLDLTPTSYDETSRVLNETSSLSMNGVNNTIDSLIQNDTYSKKELNLTQTTYDEYGNVGPEIISVHMDSSINHIDSLIQNDTYSEKLLTLTQNTYHERANVGSEVIDTVMNSTLNTIDVLIENDTYSKDDLSLTQTTFTRDSNVMNEVHNLHMDSALNTIDELINNDNYSSKDLSLTQTTFHERSNVHNEVFEVTMNSSVNEIDLFINNNNYSLKNINLTQNTYQDYANVHNQVVDLLMDSTANTIDLSINNNSLSIKDLSMSPTVYRERANVANHVYDLMMNTSNQIDMSLNNNEWSRKEHKLRQFSYQEVANVAHEIISYDMNSSTNMMNINYDNASSSKKKYNLAPTYYIEEANTGTVTSNLTLNSGSQTAFRVHRIDPAIIDTVYITPTSITENATHNNQIVRFDIKNNTSEIERWEVNDTHSQRYTQFTTTQYNENIDVSNQLSRINLNSATAEISYNLINDIYSQKLTELKGTTLREFFEVGLETTTLTMDSVAHEAELAISTGNLSNIYLKNNSDTSQHLYLYNPNNDLSLRNHVDGNSSLGFTSTYYHLNHDEFAGTANTIWIYRASRYMLEVDVHTDFNKSINVDGHGQFNSSVNVEGPFTSNGVANFNNHLYSNYSAHFNRETEFFDQVDFRPGSNVVHTDNTITMDGVDQTMVDSTVTNANNAIDNTDISTTNHGYMNTTNDNVTANTTNNGGSSTTNNNGNVVATNNNNSTQFANTSGGSLTATNSNTSVSTTNNNVTANTTNNGGSSTTNNNGNTIATNNNNATQLANTTGGSSTSTSSNTTVTSTNNNVTANTTNNGGSSTTNNNGNTLATNNTNVTQTANTSGGSSTSTNTNTTISTNNSGVTQTANNTGGSSTTNNTNTNTTTNTSGGTTATNNTNVTQLANTSGGSSTSTATNTTITNNNSGVTQTANNTGGSSTTNNTNTNTTTNNSGGTSTTNNTNVTQTANNTGGSSTTTNNNTSVTEENTNVTENITNDGGSSTTTNNNTSITEDNTNVTEITNNDGGSSTTTNNNTSITEDNTNVTEITNNDGGSSTTNNNNTSVTENNTDVTEVTNTDGGSSTTNNNNTTVTENNTAVTENINNDNTTVTNVSGGTTNNNDTYVTNQNITVYQTGGTIDSAGTVYSNDNVTVNNSNSTVNNGDTVINNTDVTEVTTGGTTTIGGGSVVTYDPTSNTIMAGDTSLIGPTYLGQYGLQSSDDPDFKLTWKKEGGPVSGVQDMITMIPNGTDPVFSIMGDLDIYVYDEDFTTSPYGVSFVNVKLAAYKASGGIFNVTVQETLTAIGDDYESAYTIVSGDKIQLNPPATASDPSLSAGAYYYKIVFRGVIKGGDIQ